jgi:hypothetical protein
MTFEVETVNLVLEIGAGIVIFIAFCSVIYSLLKPEATLKSVDTTALYMRIPVDKINGTAKSNSYKLLLMQLQETSIYLSRALV